MSSFAGFHGLNLLCFLRLATRGVKILMGKLALGRITRTKTKL